MGTARMKLTAAAIAAAGLFGISGTGPVTAGPVTRGLAEGGASAPPTTTAQDRMWGHLAAATAEGRLWGHLTVAAEDGDTAFPELDSKSLDDLLANCPKLFGGKAVPGAAKDDPLRRLQTARLNLAIDDLRALVERFKAGQVNDIALLHSASNPAVAAAADLFSDPKDLRPWLEEWVRIAKWHETVVEARSKQGAAPGEDRRAVRAARLDAEIALLKLARRVAGGPPAGGSAAPGASPGGPPAGGTEQPRRDPVSPADVRTALKKQWEGIKSARVEYGCTLKPEVDEKLLLEWNLAGAAVDDRYELAFQGKKRYLRWVRKEVKTFDGGRIEAEEASIGFDGAKAWMRDSVVDLAAGGKAFEVGDNFVKSWFQPKNTMYWRSVGLCPASPAEKGDGDRLWLLADALDAAEYRADGTEKIDGAACLVLRGKVKAPLADGLTTRLVEGDVDDILWLDPDRGWALRKREIRSKGLLVERYRNSKLKEVATGLWLPEECEYQRGTPPSAPEKLRDKPAFTFRFTVQKVSVNDVRDEVFENPDR